MASEDIIPIKIVLVGPSNAGKTHLLYRHLIGAYPRKWCPSIFDGYSEELLFDGRRCLFMPWDTAVREEDHRRLRPLGYPCTSVFLLFFSVESETSLKNCIETCLPEILYHAPGVPCILVATKVDLRTSPKYLQCIPYTQGYQIAKQNHIDYMETSALKNQGLKQLFDKAMRVALNHIDKESLKWKWSKKHTPVEPFLSDVYLATEPWGDMKSSTYSNQMALALQDPQEADVVFLVQGFKEVRGHKVILCSASDFFCQVFGVETVVFEDDQQDAASLQFDWDDINAGKVPGLTSICNVQDDKDSQLTSRITISEDISYATFSHILHFLYTGLPQFVEGIDAAIAEDVKRVAEIFCLPYLVQIVDNIQNDADDLNPSIGTYHVERLTQRCKSCFLGQDTFSDVKLNVKGCVIPAHKVILKCRCEVMSRMFSQHFVEASQQQITVEDEPKHFQALLEYLYLDSLPKGDINDLLGILQLADKYGLDRLKYMCELQIIREKENVRGCIEASEIDVMDLLTKAQLYNAKELNPWCLHFIATNYTTLRERPEFSQLDGDNLEFILKNCWPPESYLKEMEEYEDKMRKRDKHCLVM